MNTLSSALSGIQAAERQFEGAASRIATVSVPDSEVDIAAELTSVGLAKVQLQASAKVARTISDTLGTLLDTFA